MRTHWYNSRPAHEAALWADDHGIGDDFRRAVYRAYFAEAANIGSPDVLVGIADKLGVAAAPDLKSVLAQGAYVDQVSEQFERARALGITAVPAYVAGNYVMVGAQPYAVFQQLVETVLKEAETPAS